MLGLISPKVYIVIAAITAGLLAAVNFLDRQEALAGWVIQQAGGAQGSGLGYSVAQLIARPIEFALTEYWGALIGGLLWPLAILWLFLLVLLLVFSFLAPAIGRAVCSFSASCG